MMADMDAITDRRRRASTWRARTVTIELDASDDQPRGRIDPGEGTWRAFWGWLELIQSIEADVRPRASRT
jgi:hypothetical protein